MSISTSSSSSSAPAGSNSVWTVHKARDGTERQYWYNSVTKKSVWRKPDELKSPTEKLLDMLPWREYSTPEGKKYWHNSKTGVSSWSCPEELQELLQRVKQEAEEQEKQSGSLSPSSSSIAAPSVPASSKAPSIVAARSAVDSTAASSTVSQADNERIPIFFTKQEAESAFIQMLQESDIPSDWSWDQCMRAIVNKPMYKALRTVAERREAFEKYQSTKRALDKERALKETTKRRDNFKSFLLESSVVEPDSRYSDLELMLSDREEWKACSDDRDRRDIFEDILQKVRKEATEAERLKREKDLASMNRIFPLIEITSETTWDEFYDKFTSHELYNEHPNLKEADLRDLLDLFQHKMKIFEEQEYEKLRKEQAVKYRQDRKYRDAYRDMLMDLKSTGKFDANLKWKDLYQLISQDERYENMFLQLGSSPLEIYRDFIVDMEEEVFLKGRYVQSFLKQTGYLIEPESQYEKFHDHVRANNLDVTDEHLKIIFQVLVDKAVAREEEKKQRHEKRMRYLWQSFKYYIKNGEMPVNAQTSFDEIRASVGHLLDCDLPHLKLMFHKYIEKLQSDTLSEPDQETVDEIESRQRERRRHREVSSDGHPADKRAKHHRREYARPDGGRNRSASVKKKEQETVEIDYDG